MKNFIKIFIIVFVFPAFFCFAQSIRILDVINTHQYPTITAEFKAFDKDNKDTRITDKSKYQIKDPDAIREILGIECPENISAFSLILLIDRSQSMVNYNLVTPTKNAAKALVDKLPDGRSECAVMVFSFGNPSTQIMHPFSSNKKDLKDSIEKIRFVGGTDYNAAFLIDRWGTPGALTLAKQAKYKPIIIFLTDGGHDPQTSGPFRKNNVIDSALKPEFNVTIYAIALGDEPDPASLSNLEGIANTTGGQLFRNISASDIEGIYLEILRRADALNYPPPCKIKWLAACESGEVELTWLAQSGNVSDKFKYKIPDSVKPAWEVQNHPRNIFFLNVDPTKPPGYKDTTITIKAINNSALLTAFTSDPRWKIISPSLPMKNPINKNETVNITIRYTPTDSLCHKTQAKLEGTSCSGNDLNLSAGFIFLKNISMGGEEKGKQKRETKTAVFCNWSCDPIQIKSSTITGANASEFKIISGANIGRKINPGECINIEFEFTPAEVGTRTANVIINASGDHFPAGDNFQATITGTGIGNPKIQAPNSIVFETADCENQYTDKQIKIENNGGSELEITSLSINPDDNIFSFIGGNPAPLTIPAGSEYLLQMRFYPKSSGPYSAVLTIISNADNNPTHTINLSGKMDTIDISTNINSIDFGTICTDELAKRKITISNNGSINAIINAQINPSSSPFSTNSADITINSNGTYELEVDLQSATEGQFNATLTIIDQKCKYEKTITLTGIVENPKIEQSSLTLSSTILIPTQGTIAIKNTSNRVITIDDLIPLDAQFKVIGNYKGTTIPPNSSIDVTIEYNPTSSEVIQTYLKILALPCNFTDDKSLQLIGNPGKAIAKLKIGRNYNAVIGNNIIIPIELIDKIQFAESQTNTISTEITFNPNILEGIPPFPQGNAPDNITGKWILLSLPTSKTNSNEIIANLNFRVKQSIDSNCTELAFNRNNTFNDRQNVNFIFEDGRFCISEASTELSIDEKLEAKPGEVFELRFYLSNSRNLSIDVHQSISAHITYNASLFEPWENTPKGTFDPILKIRSIKFDNLPIIENATTKTPIASFKFRAMLGTDESTKISLDSANVKNGKISFNLSGGQFSLDGLCRQEQSTRLFNPYPSPKLLIIYPNPLDNLLNISLDLTETTHFNITISDIFGRQVLEMLNQEFTTGIHNISFDISSLSSGMYFVVLKTNKEIITKPIQIVK